MNEKCKYCDYVSKCSRICEYDSIICKMHRSFPKVVDKSYEQLKQENKHLDEVNCKLRKANKQLKDNWNELRKQEINRFNKTQDVQFLDVLQDMQEIESENRNG